MSANVNGWYLIPLLPYFSMITAFGIDRFVKHKPIVITLWLGLSLFTVVRHLYEHTIYKTEVADFFTEMQYVIGPDACLYIDAGTSPRETLYAEWNSYCQHFISNKTDLNQIPKGALILTTDPDHIESEILLEKDQLRLIRKK